jgi:glycosyltransferase involved in cell wall biosynthesis
MPALRRIEMPMKRRVSPGDLFDAVALFRILQKAGPFDILHCHSSKAGALGRLAGILMPRSAKVYTPHGFFALTPNAPKIYGVIEWCLSWLTDRIVTVSHREMRLAVQQMRIPKSKLTVILNGVDLGYTADRNAARQKLGFADEQFIVGFVGRLVKIKNPQRLVDTFMLLAQRDARMRLVVVGHGSLREAMDARLDAAGLTEKVRFLSDHDARDVMAGFDCLLCTSDAESFGLVMIEALHAGVPVVTTPVGIADTAINDGLTGYVGSFAPESLAEGVMKLARLSVEQRQSVRESCQQQARRFDVKAMTQKTNDLYLKLTRIRRAR